MLKEKFSVEADYHQALEQAEAPPYPSLEDVERKAAAPWWIIDLVNAAVRQSRTCQWLEKTASIRATTRAIDHTYASVELENRQVANLTDVAHGLKLALRSRVGLRADLVDFESPKNTLQRCDELAEYLLCRALAEFDFQWEASNQKLAAELNSLLTQGKGDLTSGLQEYPELNKVIAQMSRVAREKATDDLNATERDLALRPETLGRELLQEYERCAVETVCNLAWHRNLIGDPVRERLYVPQMGSFLQRRQ